MAFTAITALVSGAEVTATLVLSAMVEVGTTMSIVGAVTGNKDLMKLGGVIGLVGGVGGLINGAVGGAASAASDMAMGEASNAALAANAADGFGQIGMQGMEGAAEQAIGGSAMAGADVAAQSVAPAVNNPSAFTAADKVADVASQATPAATPDAMSVSTPQGAKPTLGAQGPAAVSAPVSPSAPPDVSAKGNSFFGFLKDPANKNLLNTGVQLVGGALQGAAQQDQFDQQMEFRKDESNYQRGRDANVSKQNTSRSGIINAPQRA